MVVDRQTEKKIKADFRKKAQKDPLKHYPVQVLKDKGFDRKKCAHCGNYFWSTDDERKVCGEPECSGGYQFIGKSPAKNKMDFIGTWKAFQRMFKKFGYTPIKRYPVVARWNETAYFTMASIADFQPYVVSGEVDPPANPLIVPQICLRFIDVDNVGITGRHYTAFSMVGQHTFQPPGSYDPETYLEHIHQWLEKGMGLPKHEIQYHEDAWAGGGNMGPSMEFFSRGLEIGNQVYMQYEINDDGSYNDLNIKVLDMGMGQERPAWFTHGTDTSYEANFPTVARKLYRKTGIIPEKDIVRAFLPYSGNLNIDEVDDIDKAWKRIADNISIDVRQLKDAIVPLSGLYSIGDHTRTLLFALTDGGLPSNVGGGYNLRFILRRALDFINRYDWDVELADVCNWHASYLKPIYPEVSENLDEVAEILEVEKRRYKNTREKSRSIVERLKKKTDIKVDELVTLYDSKGISPEMLKDEGLDIEVPVDFYTKVAESHEKKEAPAQTRKELKVDVSKVDKTDVLYFGDFMLLDFDAKVAAVIPNGKASYVALDRTAFYPTSGGQLHDLGTIGGHPVDEVMKKGNIILHKMDKAPFKAGDKVHCEIDRDRRMQLAQNHTATHLINGAARRVLGEHIWQAGAEKTMEKARLDITHYDQLTEEQLKKIEDMANAKIAESVPVDSLILARNEAENRYGFRLYQGGAVPGKELRVIDVGGFDVEACGGTHVKNTKEVEMVKLSESTKIQDGVVRLTFAAGIAARKILERRVKIYQQCAKLVPNLRENKFDGLLERKDIKKTIRFSQDLDSEIDGAACALSVPATQLIQTFERFTKDIEKMEKSLGKKPKKLKSRTLCKSGEELFAKWKALGKELDHAKHEKIMKLVPKLVSEAKKGLVAKEVEGLEMAEMIQAAKMATSKSPSAKIVLISKDAGVKVVVAAGKDAKNFDAGKKAKAICKQLGGSGGGKKDLGQGGGRDAGKVESVLKKLK